ncbi:MAG: hypothetical protein IJN27_00430 [Oscillospiraceae bacterium]|nr:hypothetical protein [Oscillospiraceae bacterium]
MANDKDVEKILQNIKKAYPDSAPAPSAAKGGMTDSRISEIVAREAAAKAARQAENKPQPQNTVAAVGATENKTAAKETHEIESEFFSKLATALKENPAVADLVEEVDENLESRDRNKVSVTAASYVDEKFVDFFTTTVAVERQPTSEIIVKRKKGGFFRKKYITDSLTLSIPQEEVDKRQQKVAKPTTAELAKDIILGAEKAEAPKTEPPKIFNAPKQETAVNTAKLQAEDDFDDEEPIREKRGLFGRRKKEKPQQNTDGTPLFMRYKTEEIPVEEEKTIYQPGKKADAATDELPKDTIAKAFAEIRKETAPETALQTEEKPAQPADVQPSYLPEAKNDSVILYYDDGRPEQPKPAPKEEPKPRDAESILKAIKAKKQSEATVVATAEGTVAEAPIIVTTVKAADTGEPTVEMKEKFSPFVPKKVSFEDTIENTAFVAPELAQEEEKDFEVVPKTETDKKMNRITGDITQMFAAAGILKKAEEAQEADAEEDEDDIEEEVFEEESFENEYITHQFSDDPAEIYDELKNFKATLAIRMGLSAAVCLVLLYLNFAANGPLPLPAFIKPAAQPMMFYLVNLVFFAVALIGFLPTLANGFTGFAKAPTQDSFVVVPAVWSFIQLNVCIFANDGLDTAATTIFAAFTVLSLGFNALGKYISANTIMHNLRLAEVPEGINAGYILKDMEDVKRLARTLEEKNPQILVSRKTGYISNFISGGFSTHRSEKSTKLLAIITAVISIICLILGWKTAGDWRMGIFAAAGASVLMLPLAHSLISSVPGSLMQKALNKVGALVNGWQGIYQLSDATHVSFDAKHLFPKGCVVLHGIKTFEKERLDLAILYAASIAIEYVDNLRNVFMTVIDGKRDMLYPIESCEYRVGQGYVAWIENNRVIMGNRSIMEEFGINLPPVSMETAFMSEGKKPIYLSVNGKMFGMFVVSYHPDHAVKENLMHLIESGKCVILQSNDFNVDSQLLELVYGLPQDTVQVLNKNETTLLLGYTAYSDSTESAMAHLDSLHSLSAGFFGADRAKRAANTCAAIQIISVLAGAILAVVFTLSKTLWSIPLTSVLLLGLGWLGLCIMRAVATKYY